MFRPVFIHFVAPHFSLVKIRRVLWYNEKGDDMNGNNYGKNERKGGPVRRGIKPLPPMGPQEEAELLAKVEDLSKQLEDVMAFFAPKEAEPPKAKKERQE